MTDTAQLREALNSPIENYLALVPIIAAAQELLTLREAGALIITPDEDGKWPEWTHLHDDAWDYSANKGHSYSGGYFAIIRVLDALRDAMPDEIRVTTLTADDVRLASQYEDVAARLKVDRDDMPDGDT